MHYLAELSKEMYKKIIDGSYTISADPKRGINTEANDGIIWNGAYRGSFLGLAVLARIKLNDNGCSGITDYDFKPGTSYTWVWSDNGARFLKESTEYYQAVFDQCTGLVSTTPWDGGSYGSVFKNLRDKCWFKDRVLYVLERMSKFESNEYKNLTTLNT